jgi:hypothetical protein
MLYGYFKLIAKYQVKPQDHWADTNSAYTYVSFSEDVYAQIYAAEISRRFGENVLEKLFEIVLTLQQHFLFRNTFQQ